MIRTLAAALATSTCLVALATPASAQTREFNVPAGSLRTALDAFARQSGRQVIYRGDVRSARSPGVSGARTAEDALNAILAGSGFVVKIDRSGAFAIVKASGNAPVAAASQSGSGEARSSMGEDGAGNGEIIVTAQKREQRLQDVPGAVTAIVTQDLAQNNFVRLTSYFDRIPGLSLSPGPRGESFLSIRGINTNGAGNPVVGIIIDDVPFGSTRSGGGGGLTPDLDPGQLQRIEVLRGPQGTIYGASSMGGLLKYVTVDPSTRDFSGRVQADGVVINGGGGLGYGLRGSVNIPVNEQLAVSVGGFYRRDPGYIDNVRSGKDDVNDAKAGGGRFAAMWRPTESVSVKLGALYQHYKRDGSPEEQLGAGIGKREQAAIPGIGVFENKFQVYTANITGELGNGTTLTSVTGYNVVENHSTVEIPGFAGLANTLFGVAGAGLNDRNKTHRFSQELRLDVPLTEQFDWLLGAFYTREDSRWFQLFNGLNPQSGASAGNLLTSQLHARLTEYAAFTNLTFHPTEKVEFEVGARQSHNEQIFENVSTGPVAGAATTAPPSSESAFTYLATARYKVSPQLTFYVRLASGYRPGGPNTDFRGQAGGTVAPISYSPDKTKNIEIGSKGTLFDGVLSYDLSVYRIRWDGIQYNGRIGVFGFLANGGRAKSDGVELSAQVRPWAGMTVSGWVSYSDAKLIEDFPASATVVGRAGMRLPYNSKWSGNLAFEQKFSVADDLDLSVGANGSWVDDRLGVFLAGTTNRQQFPSYSKFDAHIGLQSGGWNVNAFVNNLTDRHGLLSGGLGYQNVNAFNYIQPRSFGLSVTKQF